MRNSCQKMHLRFMGLALLVLPTAVALADGLTRPAGDPSAGAGGIKNPIKADSLIVLLELILNIIIEIGTPILIIAIIFVGFKFVMAQGKEAKISEARQALMWVLVGAAIVIGSKVIVEIVQNTVNSIKS